MGVGGGGSRGRGAGVTGTIWKTGEGGSGEWESREVKGVSVGRRGGENERHNLVVNELSRMSHTLK